MFKRRPPLLHFLSLLLLSCGLNAAEEFDGRFIAQQLARAQDDPQQRVVIEVSLPRERVFEAMLAEMADYTAEISSLRFDNSRSPDGNKRGVGSVRYSKMEGGLELAQEIVVYEPHQRFAYFTDLARSTVELPLDFSIGHYRFSDLANGNTRVEISVVYRPSSRLTAFLVRMAFNRALERDLRKAESHLNSL